MGLSVIGAGFGRTGTMSLKLALEQLGFGPCHHMDELMDDPSQLPNWRAAADGEPVDWDDVFANYKSTVDWPGAYFWRDLAEFYPEAKIILTVRPMDSWWESYSKTIMTFWRDILPEIKDEYILEVAPVALKIIAEGAFGGSFLDKDAIIKSHQNHIEAVTSSYTSDRLLTFEVKDGWDPLCEFLDMPVPQGDFPRSNNSAEFWEIVEPRN